MTKIEQVFILKKQNYYKQLKKFGKLFGEEDDRALLLPEARDIISGGISIDLLPEDFFGTIDVNIYYDGTFGIEKVGHLFYVKDLHSLQTVLAVFFGSPFSFNIRKIRNTDFAEYMITIPEVKVESFEELCSYVGLMKECLSKIKPQIKYEML